MCMYMLNLKEYNTAQKKQREGQTIKQHSHNVFEPANQPLIFFMDTHTHTHVEHYERYYS